MAAVAKRSSTKRVERLGGRQRKFTHEQLVEAALEVMEREGYAALSIRSLGAQLKVSHSALYGYVKNIEELEAEALRHLAATIPVPLPGSSAKDLHGQLVESLLAARAVLIRHPGVMNPPLDSAAWRTFNEWGVQWMLALSPFAANEAAAVSGHTALIALMGLSADRERIYGPGYRKQLERVRDRRITGPNDLRAMIDQLIDSLFPRLSKAR